MNGNPNKYVADLSTSVIEIDGTNDTLGSGKWLEKLRGIDELAKTDSAAWEDAKNGAPENERYIYDYGKSTQGQIRTTEDLKKASEEARKSIIAQNNSIETMGIKSKIASVGVGLLSTALNMGIATLVGIGISKLFTFIDDKIHESERIIERGEEARASIQSIRQELAGTQSVIDDAGAKYEKLSGGVQLVNGELKNTSLSSADFNEFLQANEQLAQLFPSLVTGIDQNGNSILSLGDASKTAAEHLHELYKMEKLIAGEDMADHATNVIAEINEKDKKTKKELKKYRQEKENLTTASVLYENEKADFIQKDQFSISYKGTNDKSGRHLAEAAQDAYVEVKTNAALKNSRLTGDALKNYRQSLIESYRYNVPLLQDHNTEEFYFPITDLSDEEREEFLALIDHNMKSVTAEADALQAKIDETETKLNYSNTEKTQSLIGAMQLNSSFLDLPEELQANLTNALHHLNYEQLSDDENEDLLTYMEDTYIKPIAAIFSDPQMSESLKQKKAAFLNEIFSLAAAPPEDMSIKQQQAKLNELLHKLYGNDKHAGKAMQEMRGILGLSYINDKKEETFYADESIRAIAEKTNLDSAQLETLTPEELTIACALDLEKMSFAELQKEIEEVIKLDAPAIKPPDLKDTIEQLSTMKSEFDTITKAYQLFAETGEALSPDSIQGILNAFSDIEGVDLQPILNVLADSAAGTEEVAAAFDDLAAQYLYHSGILNHLTAENADYTAQELTAMGITNAAALVTQHLAAANEYAAITGQDLAAMTIADAEAFLATAAASNTAKAYIYQLAIEKYNLGQAQLNTAADIDSLIRLAQAAGVAASYIKYLEAVKKAQQGPSGVAANDLKAEARYGRLKKESAEAGAFSGEKIETPEIKPPSIAVGTPGSSGGSGGGGGAAAPREVKETFDWIENYAEKIKEKLKDIIEAIKRTFTLGSLKNSVKNAFHETSHSINTMQQALSRYEEKANSVGLGQDYIDKIKNGTLSIEDITNEELINKIKDYETWYGKIKDCKQELKDLKDQQKEIAEANLQGIQSYYERRLDHNSSKKKNLEAKIDKKEAQGKLATKSDYKGLIKITGSDQKLYRNQRSDLTKQLHQMVKSGYIKKNSEEWFEWKKNIDSCTASIIESGKSLIEYYKVLKNIPIEKAKQKIEKLEKSNDLLDAKFETADYKSRIKIIDAQTKHAQREKAINKASYDATTDTLKADKNRVEKALKKSSITKKSKNAIRQYMKSNKPIPASLLAKLEKADKKLYDQAIPYNASLEARDESLQNYRLSSYAEKQARQENNAKKYDQISDFYDSKHSVFSSAKAVKDAQLEKLRATGKADNRKDPKSDFYHEEKSLIQQSLSSNEKILSSKKAKRSKYDLKKLEDQKASGALSKKDYERLKADVLQLDAEILDLETESALLKQEAAAVDQRKLTDQFDTLANEGNILSDQLSLKEAEGKYATKEDYTGLIVNSKAQEKNLHEQYALLKAAQKQYEAGSDQYNQLQQQMEDNRSAILEAQKNQAEYNRILEDLPLEKFERELELLEKLHNAYDALLNLREAQGLDRTAAEIDEQIKNNNAQIAQQELSLTALKRNAEKARSEGRTKDAENYENILQETIAAIYSLKTANEELTDSYLDIRIKALEKEKEALLQVNDAQDRRIALEKAQYDLERAKTQRTQRVFNGKEFVYEADREAVKNAAANLKDLEFDELINQMNDSVEALEDLKPEYNLYDENGNSLDQGKIIGALNQAADQTAAQIRQEIEAHKNPAEPLLIPYQEALRRADESGAAQPTAQQQLLTRLAFSELPIKETLLNPFPAAFTNQLFTHTPLNADAAGLPPLSSAMTGENAYKINIGDIYLNNVQEPHSLARAIVDRLPGLMMQELHKR